MRAGGIALVVVGALIVLFPMAVPPAVVRGASAIDLLYFGIVGGLIALSGWVLIGCAAIVGRIDDAAAKVERHMYRLHGAITQHGETAGPMPLTETRAPLSADS